MLPIIGRIISFALRSVLDKGVSVVRNKTADKLKDGDVSDENWRDAIVEDLDDIKTKIDELSCEDLLASHCFLKEGIDLLTVTQDETKDEQTSKVEANRLGSTTTAIATTSRNENYSVDLNEAIVLLNAIRKLQNASNDQFISAKECFKAAREEATRAFCNEALKLPDRVMAAKICVVSKILECLQDTKAAASGCMFFLKKLNSLPAIGETFSTCLIHTPFSSYFFKSKVDKDPRLENMKSVLSLNFAVSEFVTKFSGELPNVCNWPRIHLSTRSETIHPLLLDIDVVRQIFRDEEFQPPENHVTFGRDLLCCCINSKGDFVAFLDSVSNQVFTLKRSGELQPFYHPGQASTNVGNHRQRIVALAIGPHDDFYVMVHFSSQEESFSSKDVATYVLFVFNSSAIEKCKNVLNFIEDEFSYATVLVNKDGDVIIHFPCMDYLYVCDSIGNLKCRLLLEHHSTFRSAQNFIYLKCVTGQNEIIMHSRNFIPETNDVVLVYTTEGKLKRTINVKYRVSAVTYNYATSKIEILGRKTLGTTPSYCICSYSENDDVEYLYLPATGSLLYPTIVSHPAGHAALIYDLYWSIGNTRVMFM